MVFLLVSTFGVSVIPLVWCPLHCNSFFKMKNLWELQTIAIFLVGTIYIGFKWGLVISIGDDTGYDVWLYLNVLHGVIVVTAIGGLVRFLLLLTNRIPRKRMSTLPFRHGTTKRY